MNRNTPPQRSGASEQTMERALDLLTHETGLTLNDNTRQRLATFAALIRAWNHRCGLVSNGDLAALETNHIVDALSLVPYALRFAGEKGQTLDIGSGGGFPMIPMKCALPGLTCTLVERNARKVGFLHRAVAALGLDNIAIVHGSFPDATASIADIITARAVERPDRIVPAIATHMPPGCVFLCQNDAAATLPAQTFHVEQIADQWQTAGLRRGVLFLVAHKCQQIESAPRKPNL